MKRNLLFFLCLFIGFSIKAQSPDKFNYQAVIRNADGSVRANQPVNIQIGILQGTIEGPALYLETHSLTSSAQGLVNIVIGNGTVVSGSLTTINWAGGMLF